MARSREREILANPEWTFNEFKKVNNKLDIRHAQQPISYKANLQNYTTTFVTSGLSYSKRLKAVIVNNNAMQGERLSARGGKLSSAALLVRGDWSKSPRPIVLSSKPKLNLKLRQSASVQSLMPQPPENPSPKLREIRRMLHPQIPESCLDSLPDAASPSQSRVLPLP